MPEIGKMSILGRHLLELYFTDVGWLCGVVYCRRNFVCVVNQPSKADGFLTHICTEQSFSWSLQKARKISKIMNRFLLVPKDSLLSRSCDFFFREGAEAASVPVSKRLNLKAESNVRAK